MTYVCAYISLLNSKIKLVNFSNTSLDHHKVMLLLYCSSALFIIISLAVILGIIFRCPIFFKVQKSEFAYRKI